MHNLRWIFKRIDNKWTYSLLLLLASVNAAAPLLTVYIQKYLIDNVLLIGKFERLLPVLLLMAGSMVAADVLYSVVIYVQLKIQARFRGCLTMEFFRRLYRMPMLKLRNERSGQWLQNVTSDVEDVSAIMAFRIPDSLKTWMELLFLIAIVGISYPPLLALIVAVSPLYIMLGKRFSPKRKQASKDTKEQQARLLSGIEESISATREVVAFHRQVWEENRFRYLYEGYFQRSMREGKLANLQSLCIDPVKWTVHLAVLGLGGFCVIRGTMSIGLLVVLYQLTVKLVEAIQSAYSFSVGFTASLTSVERYRSAFGEESCLTEGSTLLHFPVKALEFRDVYFRYDKDGDYILKGVTFSIPVGRKVAFVGESGGGKSTIAQLLLRFYEPKRGTILVNGLPLNEFKREDWMSKISIVFQDPYLFPDSIRYNLLMGRTVTEREMLEACQTAHIDETIACLPESYDTVLGERGITWSGGQRQRLSLARAILSDSEIVILDEATSALDGETERIVQDRVDERLRDRTMLLIAHRLSTIRNADMIYVLHQGTIAEQGTYDELMVNGIIFRQLIQITPH